ncbi:MAG: sulfatase-like hydrolase/transferase [Xanthomonadales bacterium]|nr:sulfatase-like hydrolase/transferase [Xanthomonadales bacterium]
MKTEPLHPKYKKLDLLLLPFATCGFALAQPVYTMLLHTPVFLLARQNTTLDVWLLVSLLSFLLPLLLALPAWLISHRWPRLAFTWCWLLSAVFAALFTAQLLLGKLTWNWQSYVAVSIATGVFFSWVLLRTRWALLTRVLAVPALLFPLWFLFFSPVLDSVEDYAAATPVQENSGQSLPDIVFVIFDELPVATLLDNNGQVDARLFPGFARLQAISTWYANTTSVSDSTGSAIPAIMTGQYPGERGAGLTVARQPVNLFTILRHYYDYNVAESVTRFCPRSLCPRTGPGVYSRFKALVLDLSAIYLHRVVPDKWKDTLPVVTNNWSGFFASRQRFFPDGWVKHAGAQTEIDRPAYFNAFVNSIHKHDKPTLNFLHLLFPHVPNAYFPNGDNYGRTWMRGQYQEVWGDVEWGVISGKQRHYLQVQYADRLLHGLLGHLENERLLQSSLLVVLADHGTSFALNDTRRALSDINKAALLRVPLFIKYPGQMQGQRIDSPVMTVDILPTLLATLGFSSDAIKTDGIDLHSGTIPEQRTRFANSLQQRELKPLVEADLDLSELVAETRRQLKLDVPGSELWEIGPYDHLRGQTMDVLCDKTDASFRISFDEFKPLPNTDPAKAVQAYVVGTFSGDSLSNASTPFLITSNDRIVASGHTWTWNTNPIFFALVEPEYVKQTGWKPKAWLVSGNQCYGDLTQN